MIALKAVRGCVGARRGRGRRRRYCPQSTQERRHCGGTISVFPFRGIIEDAYKPTSRRVVVMWAYAILLDSSLFDSYFATVIATFATYGVVDMPCTAVGAYCQCGSHSFVMGAAFRCTCLRLFTFRMCHCCLSFIVFFVTGLYLSDPLPVYVFSQSAVPRRIRRVVFRYRCPPFRFPPACRAARVPEPPRWCPLPRWNGG